MVFLKKHWPFITALGMFWVVVGICSIISIKQNQGHFVYALDDPYIHMAIAKNSAQHGVWGVTRYGFSSSSSSLLWTLLLSLVYSLVGVNEVTPFILNMIFSSFLIFLAYFIFRGYISNSVFMFLVLSSVIFFTPLPALVFTGQEHTLHTVLTVAFVYLSAVVLSRGKIDSFESSWLLILAPLIVMTRYEGLFLVFVLGVLFLVRGNPLYALALFGLCILPVVIYGLISFSNGWYLLPNSVLLKGNIPDISSLGHLINFIRSGYQQMALRPHVYILILGTLLIFHFRINKEREIWKDRTIMMIVFIGTTCLHMQFAKTGWFYRYEAYLVALGVFVMAISLSAYLGERSRIWISKKSVVRYVPLAFLTLFTLLPFVARGILSVRNIPAATKNIYEQQYQIGVFLKKFYQGEGVAANDVGVINYLADIRCIDLWGLANSEVARAKKKREYNTEKIDKLTKEANAKIAVLYEQCFDVCGGLPRQWIKVGQWKILNNLVCAHDIVSFYAVDRLARNILIANLQEFSSELPNNIGQSGTYVELNRGLYRYR